VWFVQCGGVHPNPQLLVHLCSRPQWETARHSGEIRPEPAIGFIHLSTQAQVHLPANRIFAGHSDLVLLYLDPDRLGSPVHWEPGVPGDPAAMVFPHLYGPLPVGAVVVVEDYRPGPDGTFPALIHN
jgi:uncharacterized protein (DUF952 family)